MNEMYQLMHKLVLVKPYNNVKGKVIGYCPADQKWWIGGEINAWFAENELEIIEG